MSYRTDLEAQKKQLEAKHAAATTAAGKRKLTERIAKTQKEIDACPPEAPAKAPKAKKAAKRK